MSHHQLVNNGKPTRKLAEREHTETQGHREVGEVDGLPPHRLLPVEILKETYSALYQHTHVLVHKSKDTHSTQHQFGLEVRNFKTCGKTTEA